MHITASVIINDDESGLHHDYEPFGKLRTGCGSKNWLHTQRSTRPARRPVAQPDGGGQSRRNLRGRCRGAPEAGSINRLHFGSKNRLHFGSKNRLHFGSKNRLHFGSKNRLHFGSKNRLHFGSKNRLHFAGDGPRRAAVVAVTNGRLEFGTWERIFYGEFDGRRRKRVLVKIIGE